MPLAGDEGAIRKYAQEMESLKKKVCAAVVPNNLLPQALEGLQQLLLCPVNGVAVAAPLSRPSERRKGDAAMKIPNDCCWRCRASADGSCPPAAAAVLDACMHT